MKKILFLLALTISIAAAGQVDTLKIIQKNNAHGYAFKNLAADSSFQLPLDTYRLKAAWRGIAFKDNAPYYWNGTKWEAFASGSSKTIIIDTTYSRVGTVISSDSTRFKSLRIQVNSSTITPDTTNGTISWNLTGMTTSLSNGLTLSSGVGKWGGTLTDALTIINGASNTKGIQFEELSSISIEANTYQFQAYNAGVTDGFAMNGSGAGLQSEKAGVSYSELRVRWDTLFFMPPSGLIKIDTLAAAANMTNKKVMVWDESTKMFQQISKDSISAGGGGVSGSGTSGQIALWNGSSSVTGSAYYTWSSSTSYPNITIGNGGSNPNGSSISLKSIVGDYAHVSTDGNQLAIYGLTGTKTISIYPYAGASASLLNLKQTSTGGSATFTKTVITVDTAVGGPSLGSIHGEYAVGDSTSSATDVGRHMFRGIGTTYANDGSFNTFYSSVVAGNTTYSQDHIINWQSDAKKLGANTLDIIYHLGILGDSINGGTVNHRWGVYMYDAIVKAGATLSEQMALRVPKLKSGVRNYDIFSDSAQTVKMDGNILLGDSALAASARKTIHFFNGTAPSANISGAILYAESGELKVRDSGGNITTLSDPAGGSGTDNANVGSGYRWVKPSTQEIKTFFDGLYLDIDSSSNTDGLTLKVDTASMFPQIRSTIPASSGAQISGTPSANQIAYWASATEVTGHNGFTFSPGSYPSFQIGGTGTNEGTLYIKDAAGTAGGITGTGGFYAFGSTTYKQLDFYSHIGGSYLLQMKNNAGVLTADFQSNVAVTIASTLQVNTTIKQAGTAATLAGYMLSNSGNLASTTNLNPGVLVYNGSNNGYGMDLGYNSSRYALRLFAPTSTGISFGRMGASATLHSNFTESMYLNGSGNLGIGDATPASMLTVGSGDLFQVNSSGNIVKINNVTTSFPSSQGAANTVWQNDGSGNLSNYTITAGTQTPTATNGTNVSASTPGQEQYTRVGNVVTVSGYIDISCTSSGISSDIDLSLPVASAFTTTTQLAGVLVESVTGVASPGYGTISSNSTNDRVTISFTPRATGSLAYRYTYSYQIL